MFNKKVIIRSNFIIINRKQILWDEIVGIKEYDNSILRSFSNRLPRMELFLKNGKVVTISNQNHFQKEDSKSGDLIKIDYTTCNKILSDNVENLKPIFEHWVSWRVLLPCAIAEIIVTFVCILLEISFHLTVEIALIAAILTVPFGFIWERKTRKFNALT